MPSSSTNRKVLNQLHSLIKAIDNRGAQILLHEMGIGFSQFKILSCLSKTPGASQSEIAQWLNLTPPAISRQVEAMLGKGLIASRKNPKNRRQHILSLTSTGQDALKKAWELLDSRFGDVMAVLSKEEQSRLVDMLDRLLHHFAHTEQNVRE